MDRKQGRIMSEQCDKSFFLFFLISFFLSVSNPCFAGTGQTPNEVIAIGSSVVVGENLALAKERAISEALRKGVESYLLRRLGKINSLNNFQRLTQEIIPRAKEQVENFHILAEYQITDQYNVLVRLKINEKLMNDTLRETGVFFSKGPSLKILFLVSEIKEGKRSYWWKEPGSFSNLGPTEVILHNALQKRGFSPVNRTLGTPESDFSEEMRSFNLAETDILRWGKLFSADLVIYGQTGIIENQGISVSLRAFDVNQGIVVAEDYQVELIEKGLDGKEDILSSLEKIINSLVEKMSPAIVQTASVDHDKAQHLEITLVGLNNYRQFKVFRDFLKRDVEGVKSVKQIRVRKNSITIAVEFEGDKYRFLDHVLNHKNIPFPVSLSETEKGEILLKVESDISQG